MQPDSQPEQQPPVGPQPPEQNNMPPAQDPTISESATLNLTVDQNQPVTSPDPTNPSPVMQAPQPQANPASPDQVPNLNQSMTGSQPPKKSKTGLIIAIVAVTSLIVLLFGAIFFVLVGNSVSKIQKDAASIEEKNEIDKSNSESNAITADDAFDYKAVCEGGSILNAPAPVKPYLVESFFTNEAKANDSWVSINVGFGESYHPDSSNPVSANVVACLEQKKDSEIKRKTCDFKESTDKVVSIDFYSVEYELTYKEAKTGKVIGSPTPINGPATTCPLFTSYSKSDPKIFADPDKVALEASHKAFAK